MRARDLKMLCWHWGAVPTLRQERARLLGYKTHAEYSLASTRTRDIFLPYGELPVPFPYDDARYSSFCMTFIDSE